MSNKAIATHGGSRKIDDYWGPSLRVILADPSFLKKLMDYDRDNMAPAMVERVTEYTKMDVFEPEVVKKGSIAAAGLCMACESVPCGRGQAVAAATMVWVAVW